MQTYNRIGVTSNGYAVVGGTTGSQDISFLPQTLPDPARPNGVLAPFWTDLDGTGAPGIFATVLTDGVSSWIVLEWRVNVFGTTSQRVFQKWIGINGTEDIVFAYNPANLPVAPGPGLRPDRRRRERRREPRRPDRADLPGDGTDAGPARDEHPGRTGRHVHVQLRRQGNPGRHRHGSH